MARTHLEKSVSSIPGYAKTQFNLGNPKYFFERKSIIDGTIHFPNISDANNISLKVDFAEPHFNLASVYLDLGQLDNAEDQYRAALKLKPDYFSAELGLGCLLRPPRHRHNWSPQGEDNAEIC